MPYDEQNIFARILRGEIPCKKVKESAHALAFEDANPQAPIHVLVIPKGAYESAHDFAQNASPEEIVDFVRILGDLCAELGIEDDGYRLLANTGRHGHQEVPHFHIHLFGGRDLRG